MPAVGCMCCWRDCAGRGKPKSQQREKFNNELTMIRLAIGAQTTVTTTKIKRRSQSQRRDQSKMNKEKTEKESNFLFLGKGGKRTKCTLTLCPPTSFLFSQMAKLNVECWKFALQFSMKLWKIAFSLSLISTYLGLWYMILILATQSRGEEECAGQIMY
jgi:hypothetical protein